MLRRVCIEFNNKNTLNISTSFKNKIINLKGVGISDAIDLISLKIVHHSIIEKKTDLYASVIKDESASNAYELLIYGKIKKDEFDCIGTMELKDHVKIFRIEVP